MSICDYKELKVWQKAITLVKDVYVLLRKYPKEENFALCDQIRRSSISIPSNIAEGQSRSSKKEFYHFLEIARGSLSELETQMIISMELEYILPDELESLRLKTIEIDKMLVSLMKKLN